MTTKIARVAAAVALLYAARRYFRNWGTTKEECRMSLLGDELVRGPVVETTEAVWIDAPASSVWPWLVQIGQDRGGLYSFETLENFVGLDYHNADRIHPEWQHLAPGDEMRLAPKGWMGLRDGIVMTGCRRHRAAVHRAAHDAAGTRLGRGVVVPPHSALGRSLPATDPNTDTVASSRRGADHRTRRTARRP